MSFSKALFRLFNALQSNTLMPTAARRVMLRMMGMKVHATAVVREATYFGSGDVFIDEGVVINIGCFFDGSARITIKDRARIGPYVRILTGSHPTRNSVYRRVQGENVDLPVSVERGCWIGMGASIMPGVNIAEGCVIGASALVTASTQPNGLYTGVPAIRRRDLSTSEDC